MMKPLTVEGNLVLILLWEVELLANLQMNLKRSFIGIEVDKTHYSRTKQRLSKIRMKRDT